MRPAQVAPEASKAELRRRARAARLYLGDAEDAILDNQAHTARALWNLLHEWYTCRDGGIAKRPPLAEIDRQLREARTNPLPGWEWLALLPAQATQQVLKTYLNAWDRRYRGVSRRPRFKQRSRQMAVDVPQASQLKVVRVNRRWGEVSIPLVGRVRFRWTRGLPGASRNCPGRITGARVVKKPLGWHICFRIEEPALEVPPNPGAPVGIDCGVVHTMALSDGRDFNMPPLLSKGEQRRLRKLEMEAARRRASRHAGAGKPGTLMSKRERRSYDQIAKLRARQTRRRDDWLHKTTTDLAKSHGLIAVEDLNITNMTRSARGTLQHPGRNVRAKAGLNRSILGMAWGRAVWMLAYKCPDYGGELTKAPAAYSSQTCAKCGQIAAESRRSRERFCCVACGHTAPADTNAARVLLQRGLAARSGTASGYGVAGRGALAAGRAVKRQPTVEATVSELLDAKGTTADGRLVRI
jgi:putative transposase